MRIAAELSLYPLDKNYGTPILEYIERLKSYPGIEVNTNRMSTQLVGEYDVVMNAIQQETKAVFEQQETAALILKAVNVVL